MKLRRLMLLVSTLAFSLGVNHPALADAPEVDLALVLAVDVSSSMDEAELRLQRSGYAAAIADPEVVETIQGGLLGKVAITYVEWAGPGFQVVAVPWRVISDMKSAQDFVSELESRPLIGENDTSISIALLFSASLFRVGDFVARRHVIDISGDGPNTAGNHVAPTRDIVVGQGITVNGLPLVTADPAPGGGAIGDLVAYFRDCVTGGDGAFVVPVRDRSELATAIRKKLKAEIVATVSSPRLIWAASDQPADCTMGQKDFFE